MLNFAAVHNIRPVIEEFKLDDAGVADALDKLKAGQLRYRAVLRA
jgi:D-arabinose 1-dehydrogenase-like Zn-dependent alcohol dehydrogenase